MRSEAAELTPFLVKRLETYFILHMRCMSSKDFDLCMFISNYHRKGLSITDLVLHLITTMTKNKRLRIIKCLVTQKFQSINLVWKNCLQHSQWIGTYVFLYPNYYKYKNIKVFSLLCTFSLFTTSKNSQQGIQTLLDAQDPQFDLRRVQALQWVIISLSWWWPLSPASPVMVVFRMWTLTVVLPSGARSPGSRQV